MAVDILARDRKRGRVLLWGLGFGGNGIAWGRETETDKTRVGFEDAPEVDTGDGDPNTTPMAYNVFDLQDDFLRRHPANG